MCLQNSSYYWGFAAFVAYFNNHPLYTPPGDAFFTVYHSVVVDRSWHVTTARCTGEPALPTAA